MQGEALLEVPASGGTVTEVRKPIGGGGPHRLTWPVFLPDGRSYLYLASYPDDTGVVMFSPRTGEHGRFVAYVSDESGRSEVIVAPFSSGPGITVSIAGGRSPRWSAVTRDGRFMAIVRTQIGPQQRSIS